MRVLLLCLLVHAGLARATHDGYVEWSDGGDDDDDDDAAAAEVGAKQQHRVRGAEERAAPAAVGAEDLPRVVSAFLHTGDASALAHVNCSRRYELGSLGSAPPAPPVSSVRSVRAALDAVTRAAELLNALAREHKHVTQVQQVQDQQVWYRALVRAMLDREPRIHRSTLHSGRVHLQATRMDGRVEVRDLSGEEPEGSRQVRKRTRTITQPRSSRSTQGHVQWSAPYLECESGRFIPHWLLALSVKVHGPSSDAEPEIRGVVRVDVSLQEVDIDQCSSTGWFSGTHRCNLTTMECKHIPGHGFVLDKYKCQCRSGFYQHSRVALNGVSKSERDRYVGAEPPDSPARCLPCQDGCVFCRDDTPCLVQEDGVLRLAVVSFQGLCVLLDFVCMTVVYRFRRNKRIKASGFILLEAVLSGAALLYLPVMILYFQPSALHCILLRWVRLLGFATVYGTVILKLFRVLKMFLSRTAQRIPYMTSCRVLRLLGAILLVVLWFLVSWTSAVFQSRDVHHSLVEDGVTLEGLQFSMCKLDRWDYMMAVAELLFLLWGVYLCYTVRTVPSAFHEPRYMAVAVYNELLISAVFHIIRFTLAPGLHPDWMLMLCFVHTHLTVTVTLGLLLIPKFVFTGTHRQDDMTTEAYEDELDMGRSGSYLNSSITSAWSEHSLDPEDIREELKKLYGQLEIYKRKKMMANNPHFQKKRNSKKGIGRSFMRRITEIPEAVSRQYSREDRDGTEHGSNRSTLRRNPIESSHGGKSREDSLKIKVFSLKRSHSYDHTHDQMGNVNGVPGDKMDNSTNELSLLDTLMGRRSAKRNPEAPKVEPAESAESVPLVCKSISAHNLAIDKKPSHLRSSMIQKSLSVIASARERTLGLAGKTHSIEDARVESLDRTSRKKSVTPTDGKPKIIHSDISKSTGSLLQPPALMVDVCSWDFDQPPSPNQDKTSSPTHHSKRRDSNSKRKGSCSSKGKGKDKDDDSQRGKSRERRSSSSKPSEKRRVSETPESGQVTMKTSGRRRSSTKEAGITDSKCAEVCARETKGMPSVTIRDGDINTPSQTTAPAVRKPNVAEVCPWDHDETTLGNHA
ncbi:G-protein coupled receptor [Clarias magur]|uniref:G-protein coupled receptor n=1 Tax=Clarias magur TaxID=1594786 RepID=A0A8J4X1P7_CLAMG|nr:G-protein coupled receptor [Clarias magur]